MQTLIETLQLFKQDIANVDSSNGPCDPLSSYEKDMVALERDFFTITINQSPQIQACIQELLTCLNIPDYQKGRFTDASITVHEFLVELSRLNNSKEIERIKEYIQFIDEKMAINWRKILLAGLVLLTAVEFGLPFFGAFGGFSFVEGIVTAALFIPVVGIVAGIGITIYTIYQKITERNITVLDRVRDIAFIILGSALSLTAHGLSAGAVAIASPVLGALYVLGNGIHIINESIRFFKLPAPVKTAPADESNVNIERKQHDIRQEITYRKKRNDLINDAVYATVGTAIVAVGCFVPGGLIVMIAALAALVIAYYITTKVKKYNEKVMKERLQSEFEKIEEPCKRDALESGKHLDYTDSMQSEHGIELVVSNSDVKTETQLDHFHRETVLDSPPKYQRGLSFFPKPPSVSGKAESREEYEEEKDRPTHS